MIVLTNIISILFILFIFYLMLKYRIQKTKIRTDKNMDKQYKNNIKKYQNRKKHNRKKHHNRKNKLELDNLTPKYIDEYKTLQYCDIIPENTNEFDDYRIENNQLDIFKITKLEPQPFNYLYYYKIMNSPNTKFVNKIVTDNPITWKCRNDINRPWYNCNKMI